MADSQERLSKTLRRIESEHQEVKRAYFRRFGGAGVGSENNRKTIDWLRSERRAGNLRSMTDALSELKTIFRGVPDRREKYRILRELYAINPSIHENWFYTAHLASDFKSLSTNRHGLKACLTSARHGTLDECRQAIGTTVVRYMILLENLTSPLLSGSLMDATIKPSEDMLADIESAITLIDEAEPTPQIVASAMPLIFRIVRALLEATHYRQIESPALLGKWLFYAPCGINEGPIFMRHTNSDLVGALKSVPLLEEKAIRHHLSKNFTFEDVTG